jgi:protein gp37
MGAKSAIEWTDATWNPVTGCTKVSPGCKHCYVERLATHLQAMGNPRYQQGFTVTPHPDQVMLPLRWRQPRRIFVNSMSDLFHEAIPEEFIHHVFEVMTQAHWHTFQILTKRAERLAALAPRLPWPPNVWQGVSVENVHYTWRIACLQETLAAIRFLSIEPLLGPIDTLPLAGIHWVIVGGESGPQHRLMDPAWVRGIRDQCLAAGTPFFFKQWGGRTPSLEDVFWMDGSGARCRQAAIGNHWLHITSYPLHRLPGSHHGQMPHMSHAQEMRCPLRLIRPNGLPGTTPSSINGDGLQS